MRVDKVKDDIPSFHFTHGASSIDCMIDLRPFFIDQQMREHHFSENPIDLCKTNKSTY